MAENGSPPVVQLDTITHRSWWRWQGHLQWSAGTQDQARLGKLGLRVPLAAGHGVLVVGNWGGRTGTPAQPFRGSGAQESPFSHRMPAFFHPRGDPPLGPLDGSHHPYGAVAHGPGWPLPGSLVAPARHRPAGRPRSGVRQPTGGPLPGSRSNVRWNSPASQRNRRWCPLGAFTPPLGGAMGVAFRSAEGLLHEVDVQRRRGSPGRDRPRCDVLRGPPGKGRVMTDSLGTGGGVWTGSAPSSKEQ